MKAYRKFSAVIIVSLLLACAGLASAATMVIRFHDGSVINYETSLISSVSFLDGMAPPQSAPPAGTPLLTEDFSSGLSSLWEPIQVVGGNFEKFASIGGSKLAVNVPAGNSWGKTGIMSRSPLFTVDQNMAANPLKIVFDFEPSATTGYIIALSQSKNADIWGSQNIWFHWGKPSLIQGRAYMVNTQNQGDKGGEATTPPQAPKSVTLAIQPGRIEASTAHGSKITGSFAWMKAGVPVYLYVFSHPWAQHEAASFTLRSIKVMQ